MRSSTTPRRHIPRWSDFTPLISLGKPDLNPTRRRLARALTIDDLRSIARRRSPRAVFDYTDGAASAEISLARARSLFADLQFNPSVLRGRRPSRHLDVHPRNPLRAALRVRPDRIHPADAPRGRARGRAGRASGTACPTRCPRWGRRRSKTSPPPHPTRANGSSSMCGGTAQPAEDLIARAHAAEFEALILTVDVPVSGPRLRDVRNGFSIPPKLKARTVGNAILHPAWWVEPADDRPADIRLAGRAGTPRSPR